MLNVNVSNPKALAAAICLAVKFADTQEHNTLPTRNIMVQTAGNGVRLTATDLCTSVEFAVNSSDVIEDGEFCLPATHLKKLGEIIKDQSGIALEQTKNGLELLLFDTPTFGATLDVHLTDEFPMLPQIDPKACRIVLEIEQIARLKALTKYASIDNRRVGFDAVQFQTHDDTLFAYTTDGNALAYVKLGEALRLPNFAIPVEAVKKAIQVASTPELKKSQWTITLPSAESEVVAIQVEDTAIKVKAGDAIDLTDWIVECLTHHNENNDYLAFEPKALTDGLKKVAKLFSKNRRNANFVVIEGKANGNITMTAEVYNQYSYNYYPVEMDAEYIHDFTETEARRVLGNGDFRIVVDGKNFQSMVKDLAVSKPKFIQVAVKYGVEESEVAPNSDTVVVSGMDTPLGLITALKQV